jgi:hypothetical protein
VPGKPRHTIHLDEGEEWLRNTLHELRELQFVLAPPKRTVAPTQPVTPEHGKWPALGTVGAVASIIGVLLAAVLFFH